MIVRHVQDLVIRCEFSIVAAHCYELLDEAQRMGEIVHYGPLPPRGHISFRRFAKKGVYTNPCRWDMEPRLRLTMLASGVIGKVRWVSNVACA